MNEEQLTTRILEAAITYGWLVTHFRPAWTGKGWRTPLQGHKGFPDLVLVKGERVIFAELKSLTGKLSRDQAIWLDRLRTAGAEVYVWDERDWPFILALLQSVR